MTAERTPPADDSLLSAPLLAITEWGLCAPWTVLVSACALAVVAIAISVNGLKFKSNRLDLLNPQSEYNQRWLTYLSEFGNRDDACLVVRAQRPDDLKAAIDDLAAQLQHDQKLFESVFFRRDLSRLKAKALHYLPPDELNRVSGQIGALEGLVQAQSIDPADQLAGLNQQTLQLAGAPSQQRAELEQRYSQLAELLLGALSPDAALAQAATQSAPLAELKQFEPQYLLANDGQIGFVLTKLKPSHNESSTGAKAIARLRQIVGETRSKHPHVWIGLTGMPVIEHDEMAASQFDMLWTSIVSMTLVLLLYLAAYGGLRHVVLVNALLVLGSAYSFGFVTLAVGHLNILSSAFSAVLIGVGIDFAIHYVATYLNLRRQGCDEETALMRMAAEVGPGVVTGGVTTAAAFFMAAITDFVGIRELGIVAGGGILLCVLSTVIVLPSLILVVDRRWPLAIIPEILPAGQWFQFPIRQPRMTIAVSLAVVALVTAGGLNMRYDHNLLNLQPRHLESADVERQLLTQLDDSVWFAVSVCHSREELQTRKAALEQLPLVSKTEEIASLLPLNSPERTQGIQHLAQRIASLPSQPLPTSTNPQRLLQEIDRALQSLASQTPHETPTTARLGQLRRMLSMLPPEQAARQIPAALAGIAAHALTQVEPLRQLADPQPPSLDDLPTELKDRYVGKSGTFLLKVYPRGDIWDMDRLQEFVKAIESVDAKITGHPVQTYYASRHMQWSYIRAGIYALGAVLVLLWIDFRSLTHSLLAMAPPALGFAMLCGWLGWLDIPFNPANMIVLPLILGIGVDHGVHLVHLWRRQQGRFELDDATAVAVLLTATTTTASFGALILARHQGLQSLGQALTLGSTTCLAASIIFFPALLSCLSPNPKPKPAIERKDDNLRAAA